MLTEQKGACDSMIDEKNKLIHDFQQVYNFSFAIFQGIFCGDKFIAFCQFWWLECFFIRSLKPKMTSMWKTWKKLWVTKYFYSSKT